MKIKSGQFEILESGTVIQYKEEPLEFEVATNMTISLRFLTDGEPSKSRMEFKPIDDSKVELVLYNFHNSLGTGNNEPLPLGTLGNKKLYLSFRVFAINNQQSSRTIHYTWYLGEEMNHG